MNKSLKIYLIVSGSILGVILIGVLLVGLVDNELNRFKGGIKKSLDTFKSAHSDKDIIAYVKKEHGLNVKVIENHGPRNLKTGGGGHARVTSKNITFDVFINSFGAISGDNYEFLLAKPKINRKVKDADEAAEITEKIFDRIRLVADDQSRKFEIALTIRPSTDLGDPEFMEQLYRTYLIINKLNKDIEAEYGFVFDSMGILYVDDDAPITETLIVDLTEDFQSIEEIEEYMIQRNHYKIADLFIWDHLKLIEEIRSELPDILTFTSYGEKHELHCRKYAAIATCESYEVYITHNSRAEKDTFESYRYDNPELISDFLKSIQLLQMIDLPIDTLVVKDIYIPENLENQSYSAEELIEKNQSETFTHKHVEIRNIADITSASQIEFHEYQIEP